MTSNQTGFSILPITYVTWSRGMSRMSRILILSYRLKEMINSYVLHCFWIQRNVHISATRCPIEMKFESKCSILNGQVIYIKKSKLNIVDMWLIPLDRVTYFFNGKSVLWVPDSGTQFTWTILDHFCIVFQYYEQTMQDRTAHDCRTTFLAIRLYHVIYIVLRTGSRWRGSPTCRKQAVCVKD